MGVGDDGAGTVGDVAGAAVDVGLGGLAAAVAVGVAACAAAVVGDGEGTGSGDESEQATAVSQTRAAITPNELQWGQARLRISGSVRLYGHRFGANKTRSPGEQAE